MGGSMGHGGWGMMRSLRRDQDLKDHKVQRETLRRMVRFARPYRFQLIVFMVVVVVDALVVVVNPLILREIIDLAQQYKDANAIVGLACLAVLLALLDAGLTLTERRIAAAIGEYLIYDMRSKVFAHVQAMPIAFFSRTQTGALISRLNNDIIGAQQAFTDLLSNVVGNAVMVVLVLATMAILSWQITSVALLLVPMFLVPAKVFAPRLGRLFRQGMNLNAEMNTMMQERFNVSGAMLVKLFGRPAEERAAFDERAAGVRDIGIKQADVPARLLRRAEPHGGAGHRLRLRLRGRRGRAPRALRSGPSSPSPCTSRASSRRSSQLSNAQTDLMSAVVSFERVFEVLDIEPMIVEAPDATPIPGGPATVSFDDVRFSYPSAEDVSIASLEAVATLERTGRAEVPARRHILRRAEHGDALVGPPGRARRPSLR